MFNMIINTVGAATITVTEPAGATGRLMAAAGRVLRPTVTVPNLNGDWLTRRARAGTPERTPAHSDPG